jgi:glucose/arabinose dehydrogenase
MDAIAKRLDSNELPVKLPAGFRISTYAEDLPGVRFMAVGPDGGLHATLMQQGRVVRLIDSDNDGVANATVTIAEGLNHPHGLAFWEGRLYLAEETGVSELVDTNGDLIIDRRTPIIDLPPGPRAFHFTRTIEFGTDGRLYISIGATCDACLDEDERRAAILEASPDGGSDYRVFARGLRNAVGLAYDSSTGDLWATNNERDQLGDDFPADTINLAQDGNDFGFPRCINGRTPDTRFGDDMACAGTTAPSLRIQAHSAPLGLTFYSGDQFPAKYRNGLFVASHGSWNRSTPTGYKLIFIPFVGGRPTGEISDFATGWHNGSSAWGRPVDVKVGRDGSLYVSDDLAGRIYRVTYADSDLSRWWSIR